MNIVNVINFARGCEPRVKDDSYLFETTKNELELCKKHGFRSTLLLQYDTLIDPRYTELAKSHFPLVEVGLWMETVQPLVEDAGLIWRGRYPWDWHCDVGFLTGYTPAEREKLIDVSFLKFKEIFGFYPACVGSWHIDAYSLNYMAEKYGIKASCNCKEQYGTDGYTLWGGYYNGGYYPSKKNMLSPAQTEKEQINVPVFRMLGPDPIRQYDKGRGQLNAGNGQGVVTLEPVYPDGGGSERWVKRYFEESFNGKNLSHAYTQAGQENSFGWDKISKGLPMQFDILDGLIKDGKVTLMTLTEAGVWFRENFALTPPAAICADDLYGGKDKTVWYSCKNYRANVLYDGETAFFRDLYLFDENFPEKYLTEKETTHSCAYYTLPVVDGFRFSDTQIRAGLYFEKDGERITMTRFESDTDCEKTAIVRTDAGLTVSLSEEEIRIGVPDGAKAVFAFADTVPVPYLSLDGKELKMRFAGVTGKDYSYSLRLSAGRFGTADGRPCILPENGEIKIKTQR